MAIPNCSGVSPSVDQGVRRHHGAEDRVGREPDVGGAGQRGQARAAVDPADALARSRARCSASSVRRGGGSSTRSVSDGDGGEQIGRGVDQHRERGADQLHQEPGQRRPGGLRDRVGAVDPRMGTLEVLTRHEPGEERHRGRVVDQRRRPVAGHDHQQQRQRQDSGRPGDAGSRRAGGTGQVGVDHDGTAAPTVDERADDQPEHQVGQPTRRVEPADVLRRAVEGEHHEGLQRQQRHVGPEGRHRLAPPEAGEVAGGNPGAGLGSVTWTPHHEDAGWHDPRRDHRSGRRPGGRPRLGRRAACERSASAATSTWSVSWATSGSGWVRDPEEYLAAIESVCAESGSSCSASTATTRTGLASTSCGRAALAERGRQPEADRGVRPRHDAAAGPSLGDGWPLVRRARRCAVGEPAPADRGGRLVAVRGDPGGARRGDDRRGPRRGHAHPRQPGTAVLHRTRRRHHRGTTRGAGRTRSSRTPRTASRSSREPWSASSRCCSPTVTSTSPARRSCGSPAPPTTRRSGPGRQPGPGQRPAARPRHPDRRAMTSCPPVTRAGRPDRCGT